MLKKVVLTLKIFAFIFCSLTTQAEEKEIFDPGAMINHHVSDAHSWEIHRDLTVYLPVILYSSDRGIDIFSSSNFYTDKHEIIPYDGYILEHEHISLSNGSHVIDLSITKNVLFLFFNAALLLFVFLYISKCYRRNKMRPPKGIQSFFEPIILFIRDDIARPNIGPQYEKFLPYLLTLFFFIWFGNLLGLLPAAANMSGNIAITMVLALFTLFITVSSGNKTYWLHILDPLGNSMPWSGKVFLYILLIPIEIIGIFTKPFSLLIRLFANITAGHIIILSIIGLAFMTKNIGVGVLAAFFAGIMNLLELFVAILQAYVFTLLSSMYFGQAVEKHH